VAYDRFVLIDPPTLDRWGKRAAASLTGDWLDPEDQLAAFETPKRASFDTLSAVEREAFAAGVRPGHGQPTQAIFNFAEFWRIVHLTSVYRPFPDARFGPPWSVEHNVASFLFMGLLLPVFLAGARRALAAGDRVAILLLAFVAVHTLLHVLVHSVVRYRLPVEPFFALIAFQEIVRWTSKAPRRLEGSKTTREAMVEVAPT
jgi:hypothetical protein